MQNVTEFVARLRYGCFYVWFMYEARFSAVTYRNSTVGCSRGPLPVSNCRLCTVGVTDSCLGSEQSTGSGSSDGSKGQRPIHLCESTYTTTCR